MLDKVKSLLANPSHVLFFPSILNCPASAHLFSSTAKVIHSALKGDVVVGLLAAQLCLTLCNPLDCSLAGSSVHGISQARILEWFAIFFSRGIFLTQGLNTHLLHWQVDSLLLGHQGSPILPRSLVLSLPQSNCILLGQLYHQLSPAGPQALFIFHFLRLSFYFLVSHHSLQTYPV